MQIVPHSPLQGSVTVAACAGCITASPSGHRIGPGHDGPSHARVAPPLHAPVRKAAAFVRRWSAALPSREALRGSLAMLGNSVGRQLLSAHSGSREGAGLPRPAHGEATSVSAAVRRFPHLQASTASGHFGTAHVMKSTVLGLETELGPRSHAAVIATWLSARMTGPLIDMLKPRGPVHRG